jgi:acyl transferase domain-containing protein/NADPH:quinone reductase-like Zn-dependent oxidoreductase
MTAEEKLVDYLKRTTAELRTTRRHLRELADADREPIAIIAMSCRYPGGADTPERFWDLVAGGADAISEFPVNRGWETAGLGGFLHDAAEFDPDLFGISPREALAMDPQQRLLLETSWELFERAGVDPLSLRGSRTAVFAGVMYRDYGARVRETPEDIDRYLGNGSAACVATGRIAYTFGLEGPAVSVDTACSSSLVTLHLAVRALRQRECSLALAGGATVMSTPDTFEDFEGQGALASDGRSKAFAASADGTGWGEGVGMLLLERLSDARRNGHEILALVRGSALNQDGASSGLTAPNGPAQQRVIQEALAAARLAPDDVDAVEAHGTGTTLGDPIEAQALLATYGQDRSRPLWLGSVKSNIGHAQTAAGVAGVIKMVMAMRHGSLPRTLHVLAPSPHVDWSAGNVRLLTEAMPWPENGRPRRAGVSAFGISGTNAHVILEQAPPVVDNEETLIENSHATLPWVVTGASPEALRAQAGRLRSFLVAGERIRPADVGRTLATARAGLAHRAVVLGSGQDELLRGLSAVEHDETAPNVVTGTACMPSAPVFVFPGQGTQWPGMAQSLLDTSGAFTESVRACERALEPFVDWSLSGVLRMDPAAPPIDRTDVVQPALWAMMIALAELWRSFGVAPAAVVGHSQGEIAAACVAGSLSLADGARVVALRSRALAAELSGSDGMMSVSMAPDEVAGLLAGKVSVAAINGPRSVVLSGPGDELGRLLTELSAAGVRAKRLAVDYASHSERVEALADRLLTDLSGIVASAANVPFYSTVTGGRLDGIELAGRYWYDNLRHPVRFDETIRALLDQGHRMFVEISPHPVLLADVQDIAADCEVVTVGSLRRDSDRFTTSLAEAYVHGAAVDWRPLFTALGGRPVRLPTYAFQRRRFWLDAAAGTPDVQAAGLDRTGHPLLGAAIATPGSGQVVLTGRLSLARHPWLGDHAVAGTVVFPATGFVELALRAGEQVGASTIGELVLARSLELPPSGGVRIQVTVGDEDAERRALTVHSRPDGPDEQPWTLHATGWLTSSASTSPPDTGPWPPAGASPVDIDDLYGRLGDSGYTYGPAFAGLRAAWRRGGEVFAEIALPEGVRPGVSRYEVHPALLDPALQAVALDSGPARLPFTWSGVTLFGTGASDLRVRLIPCGESEFALHATDRSGVPVLSVDSLVFRPVDLRVLAGPAPQLLRRWDWTPVTTSSDVRPDVVVLRCDGATDAREATLRVLDAAQAWIAEERAAPATLVVLTCRAVQVRHGEDVDLAQAPVWGLVRSAQSEHPGRFALVDIDDWNTPEDSVLAAVATGEPQLAIRAGTVLAPTLGAATKPLRPPDVDRWRLDSAEPGNLDALVLAETADTPPVEGQVRIAVRAAGLNFRDVLVALGVVPENGRSMGSEAAGIVLDVGPGVSGFAAGNRVLGLCDKAFGPVASTDHRLLARMPDSWSFAQAAAVPLVFLTAYYALVDLADVQAGQTVLVHAAAGGVGMAAVELAHHFGAEVFATASAGKWDVLRSMGVAEDHICSSRTTDFEDRVRAVTGGRGVDVVLNSLTGRFVDASLRLVAPGGRFLEMGKTDIRDQTTIDHPGIAYQAFDVMDAPGERIRDMLAELLRLLECGALRHPLLSTWDICRAPEAFRFMSMARHVGKIVLTVPRPIDPGGTVLITGGTGTLGALVARHLVRVHGVGRLVLLSRSGAAAPGAEQLRAELSGMGAHVTIEAGDAADRTLLDEVFAAIGEDHPLTAVVHAAGVLHDGLIGSLTPQRLDTVWQPKVTAAWHLHELTRQLDLAAFVLFSSAAGVLGAPGQANYASANAFLDALAQHRRAGGLPAVSLAWGLWEHRGGMTERVNRADLAALSTSDALACFDAALAGDEPLLVPIRLGDSRTAPARKAATDTASWRRRLARLDTAERDRVLHDLVLNTAAAVLGHADIAALRRDRPFKELGFDSLTAVEFRNRLGAATGLRLPVTLVFDQPTPEALVRYLHQQMALDGPRAAAGLLADLDRVLATAMELPVGSEIREEVTGKLRSLLSTWERRGGVNPAELTTDEQLFEFIDSRFGSG